MAFGSGARSDIEFRAVTGEAKRDISDLRRVYQQSTGAMSSDALRLAVAQEKLDRAIARHGPTSQQAKTATLGLRREMDALGREQQQAASAADRAGRSFDRERRDLSQLTRGAAAGSGAFRGLGRQLAFAASSFLGGAGLIYGIKAALQAASNLHEQTSKTEQVFKDASAEVIRFSKDALGLAQDQALETASSIGALLRPMGVIPKQAADISIELTDLGRDLASFYNTDVADALAAIQSGLVGQVRPLRRYGVSLDAARVQQLALNQTGKEHAKDLTNQEKLLARVSLILKDTTLAQGDYARTIGGVANQEREVQRNLRNTEIEIGQKLEPAYLELLKKINAYLGDAKNQEEITRHVERALHDAGLVAKGFAEGLNLIRKAVTPVVGALGGLDRAVEVALVLGLALKVRKAALSFGLIRAASATTATAVVANAAEEDAAIAGVGTTAEVAGAKVAGISRMLGALRGLSLVVGIDLLFRSTGDKGAIGFVERTFGGAATGFFFGGPVGAVAVGTAAALAPTVKGIVSDVAGKGGTSAAGDTIPVWGGEGVGWVDSTGRPVHDQVYWWKEFYRVGNHGRPVKGKNAHELIGGIAGEASGTPAAAAAATGGRTAAEPLTPAQRVEERISQARLGVARSTPGASRELVAALQAQVENDRRNERVYEDFIAKGIGNRSKHIATLQKLRADEASALNEIQSIEDARARDAKSAADKAKAAADKRHTQALREASTLPKRFQIAENEARTLAALGDVYRSELAFQKQVVARLRRSHAAPDLIQAALLEESKLDERIRKNREAIAKKERAARDAAYKKLVDELSQPSLELRIRQAKIDVRKAEGKDTRGEELALLKTELAEAEREYQAALKVAGTRKKKDEVTLAYWEERAQLEQRVADLKNQQKANEGALAREFAQEYLSIVGSYAPNVLGGTGAGASPVTVNQHFPHPPTRDGHQEATWAKLAMQAVFDG